VAAVRGLVDRRYRNPAGPKPFHAQPPLHGNASAKKAPAIVKGALLRLYQVGRPNPIAAFAATIKG